jgi:hypothetical protein
MDMHRHWDWHWHRHRHRLSHRHGFGPIPLKYFILVALRNVFIHIHDIIGVKLILAIFIAHQVDLLVV